MAKKDFGFRPEHKEGGLGKKGFGPKPKPKIFFWQLRVGRGGGLTAQREESRQKRLYVRGSPPWPAHCKKDFGFRSKSKIFFGGWWQAEGGHSKKDFGYGSEIKIFFGS